MFLAFGLTFEVPIVVVVLARLGIMSVEKLKELFIAFFVLTEVINFFEGIKEEVENRFKKIYELDQKKDNDERIVKLKKINVDNSMESFLLWKDKEDKKEY
jgi:recombinational DNA repair protein RecR